MRYKFRTLFMFIVLSALAAAGCQKSDSVTPPQLSYEPTVCLRPTCEEVSVIRGDVTVSLSPVGSLRYGDGADLSFGGSGRISSISVREGTVVETGQVLATLERSSLRLAVLQARASLVSAEDSLQEVLRPLTSEDLLRAKTEAAVARDVVDKVQEALKVAKAKQAELELAEAEAAVSASALTVQEAENAVELLKSEPTMVALDEADASVAARKLLLLIAEENLAELKGDINPLTVKHLENQFALAKAQLKDALMKLADMKRGPDRSAVSAKELELEIARLGVLVAQLDLVRLRAKPRGFEPIEATLLQRRITLATLRLDGAEERLRVTKAGPTASELAEAEAAVSAAAIAEREAGHDLEPTMVALAEAKALVDARRLALLIAEERLAKLKSGVDSVRLEDQENRLVLARIDLEGAQETLAKLKSGPDQAAVNEKQREVNSAKKALLEAQQELTRFREGPSELEIELRRGRVRVAKSALEVAKQRLRNAIMVAPFDGVVRAVNVGIGLQVKEETVVMELVDTNSLEIIALMSGIDARQVHVGLGADIRINGLRNMTFQGRIARVSPIYRENLGDFSYEVVISGESLQSEDLVPGMTAVAEIILEKRPDVLVIPPDAIGLENQQPTVDLVTRGNVLTVQVTTGLSNGRWVEVKEGLQEGDVVRVRYSNVGSLTREN